MQAVTSEKRPHQFPHYSPRGKRVAGEADYRFIVDLSDDCRFCRFDRYPVNENFAEFRDHLCGKVLCSGGGACRYQEEVVFTDSGFNGIHYIIAVVPDDPIPLTIGTCLPEHRRRHMRVALYCASCLQRFAAPGQFRSRRNYSRPYVDSVYLFKAIGDKCPDVCRPDPVKRRKYHLVLTDILTGRPDVLPLCGGFAYYISLFFLSHILDHDYRIITGGNDISGVNPHRIGDLYWSLLRCTPGVRSLYGYAIHCAEMRHRDRVPGKYRSGGDSAKRTGNRNYFCPGFEFELFPDYLPCIFEGRQVEISFYHTITSTVSPSSRPSRLSGTITIPKLFFRVLMRLDFPNNGIAWSSFRITRT